jgi:hypothetical protein
MMTLEFSAMNGPFRTSPLVPHFNEDCGRGTPAVRIARNEEQISLTLSKRGPHGVRNLKLLIAHLAFARTKRFCAPLNQ